MSGVRPKAQESANPAVLAAERASEHLRRISADDDAVVLSGESYAEGHIEGGAEVSYDQGPDEPPYDTVEPFSFHARTMAHVILSVDRRTFGNVEVETTQPRVHAREYGKVY